MRDQLRQLIVDGEDFLMNRILQYAREKDYTRFTSTLQEAWRASIVGLSNCLLETLDYSLTEMEPHSDDDFQTDSLACFGVVEARLHRRRGIPLAQFLGLMKYYRRSFHDLIERSDLSVELLEEARQRILLCFDRIEIAFCAEWGCQSKDDKLLELQDCNRWLTNEKNLYLTVFESLDSPVLLLDESGNVLNLNLAAQWLLLEPETRGAYHCASVNVEIWPWLREELDQLRAERSTRRDVIRHIEGAGGGGVYHFRLQKLLDVSEKLNGTVVLMSDVSELQRLNNTLAVSNRELQRYASVISHDLRAPLRSVHSFLDLLDRRCQTQLDEEGRNYLQHARRGAIRMGKMITGLLMLSMLGKNEKPERSVALQPLIQALRLELDASLSLAGATLVVDDLPKVAGNPILLSQLFQNLILNSIRYARKGVSPRITFTGSVGDGFLKLHCIDNGIGIQEEALERIFDPFFKISEDESESLGLGLSICQRIVEFHGGRISALPGVKHGAVIELSLPLWN